MSIRVFAALLLSAALSAVPALAHGFRVVLLLPGELSPEAERAMVRAFAIAANERDAHAGQESLGHLGGLDVDLEILPIQPGKGGQTVSADVAIAPVEMPADPPDVPLWTPLPEDRTPEGMEALASQLGVDLAGFRTRFREQTGLPPTSEAILVYLAARRIDRAVRSLGGVDDRDALARALRR